MKYFEALDVEVDFNDDTEIVEPDGVSFSVRSSIYNLLPTFTMEVSDLSGLLQEFMYFIHGSSVTIRMSYDQSSKIENTFTVVGENVDNIKSPGTLGGIVRINGFHEWHSKQKIRSTAYRETGSGVVQSIVGGYEFKNSHIESTSGEHIWYQPLISDVDMIQDVITPYVVSSTAGDAPFFSWIDNQNRFTFQSANELVRNSIFKNRETVVLEYYPDSSTLKSLVPNTIFTLRRLHDTRDDFRENQNIDFFTIDRATGELQRKGMDAYSIVPEGQKLLPSMGDIELKTKAIDLNYSSKLPDEKRINQAQRVNEHVNTLFSDRFFLIVQFNPNLSAGGKVNLRIHTALQQDTNEYSQFFSGNYIIESCEHTWNGDNKRAYTLLTVGRRYVDVPKRNAFRGRLLKNEG